MSSLDPAVQGAIIGAAIAVIGSATTAFLLDRSGREREARARIFIERRTVYYDVTKFVNKVIGMYLGRAYEPPSLDTLNDMASMLDIVGTDRAHHQFYRLLDSLLDLGKVLEQHNLTGGDRSDLEKTIKTMPTVQRRVDAASENVQELIGTMREDLGLPRIVDLHRRKE